MKKEDIELLKLAATAAEMYYDPTVKVEGCLWVSPPDADCQSHQVPWNPLIDDGDALRLAVRLQLSVEQWPDEDGNGSYTAINDKIIEDHLVDPYAATRRAIVRAAAEIGKTVP